VNTRMPTIDALQQIRNGCAPRRPTPQKKALANGRLVRDSRLISGLPSNAPFFKGATVPRDK
jgi:hypothetical protein